MAPDERRKQLIGIGLRMLAERPIQQLSVDAVAAEAGISRGLLFHYFATKSDFYDAVLGAAVRRTLRNTAPDEGVDARTALWQMVERFYQQIERRRDSYLALVYGNGALPLGGDRVQSVRAGFADRVAAVLGLGGDALPVTHAWHAYVEDRALQWSGLPPDARAALESEVTHGVAALDALLAVP